MLDGATGTALAARGAEGRRLRRRAAARLPRVARAPPPRRRARPPPRLPRGGRRHRRDRHLRRHARGARRVRPRRPLPRDQPARRGAGPAGVRRGRAPRPRPPALRRRLDRTRRPSRSRSPAAITFDRAANAPTPSRSRGSPRAASTSCSSRPARTPQPQGGAHRLPRGGACTSPVAVSATIEPTGTTLGGQTIEAVAVMVEPWRAAVGGHQLLDRPGPDDRARARARGAHPVLRRGASRTPGMPDDDGRYHETPEEMAGRLSDSPPRGWINLLGGCCGTTTAHVRRLREVADRARAAPAPGLRPGAACRRRGGRDLRQARSAARRRADQRARLARASVPS